MYDFEGARNITYISQPPGYVFVRVCAVIGIFPKWRELWAEFLRWTCVVALPARALSCWQEEKDCKALVRLRRKKDNRPLISGSKFQDEGRHLYFRILAYPEQ